MDAVMKDTPGRPVMSFGIPNMNNLSAGAGSKRSKSTNQPQGLSASIDKPFHRLDNKTWLHDCTEADVYILLIDTYRLRLTQDPKKADRGNNEANSDEENSAADNDHGIDPIEGFCSFLKLFDNNPELLPKWWTADKAEECIKLGQDDQGWSSLYRSLKKSDVIERYGDMQFGVQLCLFGEQVYGTPPADTPGLWMLGVFKPLEALGIQSPMVDEF